MIFFGASAESVDFDYLKCHCWRYISSLGSLSSPTMIRRPRMSKTSVAKDVLYLYPVFGPTEISPIFRPQTDPRTKSARIKIMASRVVRGEFNGSAFKAAQLPITASMDISRAAIEYQMQKIDPAAHAARLADHARVEAEAAAAQESGKSVQIVFCESGGALSAKTAAGKLEKQFKGDAVHQGMNIPTVTLPTSAPPSGGSKGDGRPRCLSQAACGRGGEP